MAVASGKDGSVSAGGAAVAEVTSWRLNRACGVKKYHSSSCGDDYKRSIAGVREADGVVSGLFDPTTPQHTALAEGGSVSFSLYVNATRYYTVPAVIETFVCGDVDIMEGELVPFECTFQAHGDYTGYT